MATPTGLRTQEKAATTEGNPTLWTKQQSKNPKRKQYSKRVASLYQLHIPEVHTVLCKFNNKVVSFPTIRKLFVRTTSRLNLHHFSFGCPHIGGRVGLKQRRKHRGGNIRADIAHRERMHVYRAAPETVVDKPC
ncbi:hypothetical protein CHS0354_039821 [Potamilus streckersoni]|uniref:Uncharacterized protein n=1 Tax=Potamilus streckersoni TaxID=2493646 RepID=A0AAE0RMK5_9BIVA|nr:hypothetical protein CHS0354_039821 [Potamilus streckersoni]